MKTTLLACFFLPVVLLLSGCVQSNSKNNISKEDKSIVIFWAEWVPAHYLQKLADEFTEETGIKVTVKTTPFDTWQSETFDELERHGQAYDLVVGDSQWLGRGSKGGHYIELTKWAKEKGIDKTMDPATVIGYSEYPKGSGRYWAVPLEGDAMGWAYRKDLFEDPKEKKAFREKYGYELDVPKTWMQLKDIAEFFYRPDGNFYGVSIINMENYDGITMGFENVFFSWGADWGDANYRAKDYVNSQKGIEALEFYKELYKFCPPNWENSFWGDATNAITEGKAAMSMNYFAFFPDLVDPKINKYADVTGFFSMPKGPEGQKFSALGGMGISVVSYSKKKDLAFKFLEWFAKDETQREWAKLGGYTCNKKVLESEEFLSATPYNRAFMESMGMAKDFWVTPEYDELLGISQKYLHGCVVHNAYSAEEAMNSIAREWENVFEYAGYYKE